MSDRNTTSPHFWGMNMNKIIQIFGAVCLLLTSVSCEGKVQEVSGDNTQLHEISNSEEEQQDVPEKEIISDDIEGELLDYEAMSTEEREIYLTGIWYIFFPTPNENWGHYFMDDYTYIYWDYSSDAILRQFFSSEGIWRLQGAEVQVNLSLYKTWDMEAEQTANGFMIPDEAARIATSIEDTTWYTIGTLESIRTGIVKDGVEFPPEITLKPLLFDKVLDDEKKYYRNRP